MTITIDDPARLNEFVRCLRGGGCIALCLDERTVEALVPGVASPLSERRELQRYLKSWQIGNDAASAPAAVDAAPPVRAMAAVA